MVPIWLNLPRRGVLWPSLGFNLRNYAGYIGVMVELTNQNIHHTKVSRRGALRGLALHGLALGAGGATLGGLAGAARAQLLVAAQPSGLSEYERKLVAVAMRERDRMGAMLLDSNLVAIADFARPSHETRLFFMDMVAGHVSGHLVAHGRGSDPEHVGYLQQFSNSVGSLATSRGAYLTTGQYEGKYGASLRLRGMDQDNSNAFDRAIVMHPAWYAAPDMLAKYGKLGRSEGCFAMAPDEMAVALSRLGSGRLLFADRIVAA